MQIISKIYGIEANFTLLAYQIVRHCKNETLSGGRGHFGGLFIFNFFKENSSQNINY
jgi:hypothetical protein